MYTTRIERDLAALGLRADPRHVEAWMRLEHSTLDWMDAARFRSEVRIAVECIRAASAEQTSDLARSLGLS